MEFTKYQKETLEIVKEAVMNSEIIKGVLDRKDPINEKVLEDLLNSELNKAINNIQGFLLELMIGKHNEKLQEMASTLYNKIYKDD